MEIRITELVAAALILFNIAHGASRGLLLTVFSVVRAALIVVVTILLVPLIIPLISADLAAKAGISLIAALFIAVIAVAVISHILKLVDHIPVVNTINKMGGAIAGLVMGILFVWIALLFVGAFQDAQWCHEIAGYVKQSELLMFLQKYNPLPSILKNFNIPTV